LVIRNTENRELYLIRITQSTLTLFMAWVSTNNPDNTIATNDFAIAANTLDRSHNFHLTSPDI
jgi:DeoR/GlpR family transcriptional regulator of sugar metabolism